MKCEASIHSFFCQGKGTNQDHMTPRCIGHLDKLKWVFQKDNFQYLDPHCHALKDFDTPYRLWLRERQKAGEFISLEEYLSELSFEIEHITGWDETELDSLLKQYADQPDELAMILEEVENL